MNWLTQHFQTLNLDEDHEGYFLGRGGKDTTLSTLGIKTWAPLLDPSPDENFRGRYGPHGEKLVGWYLWPLKSPRGHVVGMSGRRYGQKVLTRYLLPEAAWNPVWVGLHPEAMSKIYGGANIWVVEGVFDLLPLEWVVPSADVVLGSERAQLTNKHVEFLRRYVRDPYKVFMVYDNDSPGRKGVRGGEDEKGKFIPGALQRLQRVKVSVDEVVYHGGSDPGEIWTKGGLAAMQAAAKTWRFLDARPVQSRP